MKKLLGLFFFFWASIVSVHSASSEWQEIKGQHFVIYYKEAPIRFVKTVMQRAEDIYKRTSTSLGFTRYKGWIGGARVKIYIYDDAQDYKNASGLDWAAGSVVTASRVIATFPSARGFFDATLPHELGHIIFRDFVGPDARIPLWLEEGVAMLQEDAERLGSDGQVVQSITDGTFIPLAELNRVELTKDTDHHFVGLFYAESVSLVGFLLNEGDQYRFVRLMREMKDGNRFEWALKKCYSRYRKFEDLEEAWKDYLKNET